MLGMFLGMNRGVLSNISFMEIISFGSSHTDDTFTLAAQRMFQKKSTLLIFFYGVELIIMGQNMKQDFVWFGMARFKCLGCLGPFVVIVPGIRFIMMIHLIFVLLNIIKKIGFVAVIGSIKVVV